VARAVLSQSKGVVKAIAEHFRNYFEATVKFQIAVWRDHMHFNRLGVQELWPSTCLS